MSRPHTPEPVGHRPLYARMLRLRFLTPSGFLCFVFLEGAVALGILLALAELVSWWGVLVLPATVAIMVKLNDVIAGSLAPPVALGSGLGAVARSAGADAFAAAEHAHAQAQAAFLRPDGVSHEVTGEHRHAQAQAAFLRPAGVPHEVAGEHGHAEAQAAFLRPAGVSHEVTGRAFASYEARVGEDATTRLPGVIDHGHGAPIKRPWAERAEAQQQWIRQSATRRYE